MMSGQALIFDADDPPWEDNVIFERVIEGYPRVTDRVVDIDIVAEKTVDPCHSVARRHDLDPAQT